MSSFDPASFLVGFVVGAVLLILLTILFSVSANDGRR